MDEGKRRILRRFGPRLFSVSELSRALGIRRPSLGVVISRWAKEGSMIRMGSGLYALVEHEINLEREAARLYAPAYLSFETILAREGWLTLLPQATTFATTRKTKTLVLGNRLFHFRQLAPALFFGFTTVDGVATASSEKALLDLAYMVDLGRATFPGADDFSPRYRKPALDKMIGQLPPRVRLRVRRALENLGRGGTFKGRLKP